MKKFVQIGVTAARTPTGGFLPSVPLYIEVEHLGRSGLTPATENAVRDIAGFFIEKLADEKSSTKGGDENDFAA